MRIPFGTIFINKKSKFLIKDILDSNRVCGGKYVREFEKQFARLIGTKESVAVRSGADTDALALAVLYDLGAKRGDEIRTSALSFVATSKNALLSQLWVALITYLLLSYLKFKSRFAWSIYTLCSILPIKPFCKKKSLGLIKCAISYKEPFATRGIRVRACILLI